MFWGLTIEPGKHYSQTVEQSFHVSMAALDTREKSGMTQLLVRHEKAEFLLCTLQTGDGQTYPLYQQALNLNLTEGSEISFYTEGKGTIHLTGYLVNDEPIGLSPSLLQAEGLMLDEEEDSEEDEEFDEDEDEEDYSNSEMESYSSADLSWQQMIQEVEEDEDDSEGEEWTPKAKHSASKKGLLEKSNKKRRSQDSTSDEITFPSLKKKRKAALAAEAMSHEEAAQDNEEDDDEEDDDFVPGENDDDRDDEEEEDEDDEDFDEDDDDFDEDEEEEEEEDEEEDIEQKEDKKKEDGEKPNVKGMKRESVQTSPVKVKTPKKEKLAENVMPKQKTSPVKTPTKATDQTEETKETPNAESVTKKKKKKKQKNKPSGSEEDKEEIPRKKLGMDNKENIQAQQKTPKSEKKQLKEAKSPASPKKIKLPSGTTFEDLKTGEGKMAKPGRKVFMFYRGTLAHNHKEFDSCLTGNPFMFNLGRGEVIHGWDEGIKGMKVGGKRRLVVPPSQGYGNQRMGPIPPNSTLIFDVELKQVR